MCVGTLVCLVRGIYGLRKIAQIVWAVSGSTRISPRRIACKTEVEERRLVNPLTLLAMKIT